MENNRANSKIQTMQRHMQAMYNRGANNSKGKIWTVSTEETNLWLLVDIKLNNY